MTTLVAVFGASPGIGKSTLARRLAADAPARLDVDQFDEGDILSRPEFATVAAQFGATGVVDLDALLDAAAWFVDTALKFDLVVTDTLFPFVPSLLAWGHDERSIRTFLTQLHTILEPLNPVIVYLDGEPADALPRAAARDGEAWLDAFVTKVSSYKTVLARLDLAGTVSYLRHERDVTLRSLAATGYVVVLLTDAHLRSPDDLAADATSALVRHEA